jgi:transposase
VSSQACDRTKHRLSIDAPVGDPPEKRIELLESALKFSELRCAKLQYTIDDLLRRLYGPKTDKVDPGQLALLTSEMDADRAIAQAHQPQTTIAEKESSESTTPKRKGGGRHCAPGHLPIEIVRIDPPAAEILGMRRIRDEITEEIEYRPSQHFRRHIIRGVFVREDGEGAPIIAALPPRVIPQASVGPGLIAHTLVAKYVDHCPLYRQEKIAARSGVDLPRQKLGRWVEASAQLLLTIHAQLAERVRQSGYIQADETPVRVLDPDRSGKAAQAYLWTYHSPLNGAIVFDFNLSRGRASPERFIPEGWAGSLQSDGYELYASLARERPRVTRFGCLAHCRRKVADAIKTGDAAAVPLLLEIGKLYAIEKSANERDLTDHQRGCLRHAKARPILKNLQRMFADAQKAALPKSALGEAARYAINQWPELSRYAKAANGRIRIDNNPVERGIRPTKLGMRNWMFIGHPNAGWRSAVIYTIVGTCKLLNINPENYLTWVLPRLAAATTKTATGLLPHDYATLALH